MRGLVVAAALLCGPVWAGLTENVRMLIKEGRFEEAERQVAAERARGVDSTVLESLSWLGRGALDAGKLDLAGRYAGETRKLVLEKLKTQKLDGDRPLLTALGASIEVEGNVLARQERRAEAVAFLQGQLKSWYETPLRIRIQKNLNLLTLEGKAAPALEVSRWLGTKPLPLAALKGRPVLLFFWSHWCPYCKAQVPVVAEAMERFGRRGLVVIGPTQEYGFGAGREEATPEQELAYIDKVRTTVYGALAGMAVPVSEENFRVYGASTIPTLVLIDRKGIVRMYRPEPMKSDELNERIRGVM